MSKILVPTDFSEVAINALNVAVKIAKRTSSEIVLLNALDYSAHIDQMYMGGVTPTYLNDVYGDLKVKSDSKLKEVVESYSESGVNISFANKAGFLKDAIAQVLEEETIDLIVMGSKGSTGLEEVFVGSNAEKVVRFASCPVLVVGKGERDIEIENIMFAFDFEEEVGEGFRDVIDFAKKFGAKLHLVRINSPHNFWSTSLAMSRMNAFADKWALDNYVASQYDHEKFEYGIVQYAKSSNIQMIAIGTHGRKGLSHMFQGSKVEEAVNHITMPILTFKIKG